MSNDRIVIREPRLDLGVNREVPTNLTGEQAYDWLAIHHPKTNAAAVRNGDPAAVDRPAAFVDGELEAVRTRGDRNGIPLVMKDLILETTSGNKSVMIPSPVAGYAEFRNDDTNAISLWSKPLGSPGNELVGQVLHGARNSSPFKPGEFVPYGAPLVRQSDVGSPGAVHAHIEVEPAQFKKYLGDILSERINTQRRPDGAGPPEPSRPADPMADGVLKKGEEGPAVKRLQEALNKAGILDAEGKPLPTTGYFGDKTEAAVIKYQQLKGLDDDGKAGENTLKALGLYPGQQPTQTAPQQPAPQQPAPQQPAPQQPAQTGGNTWPAPGNFTVNRADKPGEGEGEFGTPRSGGREHKGIDISGRVGDRIESFGPGRVIYSGTMSGYGNTVVVQHDNGLQTLYAHLDSRSVQVGARVTENTEVGRMGRSGNTPSGGDTHLHFEIRENSNGVVLGGTAVDPRKYLEFPPRNLLVREDQGPDVKRLQEALNKAGIRDENGQPLPTTGYFGEKTEAAVIKYQRQKGLEDDGKAGNDTLTALGLKQADPAQARPGPTQQAPTSVPQVPAQQPPPQQPPPQQPAQTLPADVQRAKTNIESWHLGQTSAQFETSNRGPGFISTGQGDLGGKSYGLYQLSSTQGSLAEYVGQSTRYGAEFKGLAPASAAFDAKWKEVAARDPQGFSTDQHTFIKKEFFDVQNEALKGRGIDLGDRGRAVQDMLWSTSVQFRNLTPNVVANGLKDKFGEGYQLSRLTDEQIVGAVQDYKLKRNDSLFSGSPKLWPGLRDRAVNEKAELTELSRDEQTLKKAGVTVPMDLEKGPSPNATGGRKADPMADGVLKKGEEGPAVQRLQEALNKAGIRDAEGKPLPTTGYFGDKTEAAVIKFQQQKGLEDDGKAGKNTLTALGLLAPAQNRPITGPTPPPTDGQTSPSSANGGKSPVPSTDSQPPPPTLADKPLISNPNHPDNKLYQQAVSNLEQLGSSGGFKSRDELLKAAAAVAADAKATGLSDISHVSRTTSATGQTLLVAVEGNPANPAAKMSYIDYNQAVNQTVDQSSKMTEASKATVQAQQTPRVEEQTDKIAVAAR